MKNIVRVSILVVSFSIFFNTSCEFSRLEPVRIGVFPRPGCEIVWIAKEKGFFKEEGLDVIISQYSSWISNMNAFSEGKVDISLETLMSTIVARRPAAVIALTDRFKGDVFVGKKTMKSIADLGKIRGKPISAELGTDGYYILNSVLQKLGLSQKDVNILPQFTDDAVDSFIRGDISAVFCYPPYLTKALKNGRGRILYSQDFCPFSPSTVIVASKKIVKTRPQDVTKFIRAWFKAVDFFRTHQEEAIKIMADAEGVTTDEFMEFLSDLKIYNYEEAEGIMSSGKIIEYADAVVNFLKSQGVPVGRGYVKELIDSQFLKKKRIKM